MYISRFPFIILNMLFWANQFPPVKIAEACQDPGAPDSNILHRAAKCTGKLNWVWVQEGAGWVPGVPGWERRVGQVPYLPDRGLTWPVVWGGGPYLPAKVEWCPLHPHPEHKHLWKHYLSSHYARGR